MAREADVTLLITASGSFVNKHKLAHIKKRSAHTRFQKGRLFFKRSLSI